MPANFNEPMCINYYTERLGYRRSGFDPGLRFSFFLIAKLLIINKFSDRLTLGPKLKALQTTATVVNSPSERQISRVVSRDF